MSYGIPQVHLTNTVKLKGHKDVEFTGSSFLINYNKQVFVCSHAELLTPAFGVIPGIKDKKEIPEIVTQWILSPRVHVKSFFKNKLVIENPMHVIKYLNLSSPTKILLMDMDTHLAAKGNYSAIQLSDTKVEKDMDIMLTTCPTDRKDITQEFYWGKVIDENVDGLFAFVLDDKIPHTNISGSPVGDTSGGLIGMIVSFSYVEDELVFYAEKTTQLKKDLIENFGEKMETAPSESSTFEESYIYLSIDIEGDGFGSAKELDLRAKVENEIEKRMLGKVVNAGSGLGKMDITIAGANNPEGIINVLKELKLLDKTEISFHNL